MSGLFDIKNRLDIMIFIGTGLHKSIIFQDIPIIIKSRIILVILLMFTLMANQICIY